MLSLSDCSQARCTAPTCSWIQKYLQSLHLKNMLWAICTKSIKQTQSCSPNEFIYKTHFLLTPSSAHLKCVSHNPHHLVKRTQPWRTANPTNPEPLTHSQGYGQAGTLPCRSGAQAGCTTVPTQPTKKSSLCVTGTTTNPCKSSSQPNFKFCLNSRTASLPYINFTLYDASIFPILREHQYFRTLNQCVWYYFKKHPPNSWTTFKTAS